MVKIAIAGGSGQVAREVIDALRVIRKHDITILSRKDATPGQIIEGTTWVKVNYHDRSSLVQALQGIHTVLSFILVVSDEGNVAQKNLVDAAIEAGVERYAPSEWGSSSITGLEPWYAGKVAIREYLKEVNKHQKVLEYTLFQPGLFLNDLATPYKTAKHLAPLEIQFDFEHRRAIIVDGAEDAITFTTVQDLARVVAKAIEYEGEWPVVGGICGNTVSSAQVIALGEKVRGKSFDVERLKLEDLRAGEVKSSWEPQPRHPALTEEQSALLAKPFLGAFLAASVAHTWAVSDEWNQLLPDFQFTDIKQFLSDVWTGKP